uniref:Leucine-rich repeat-containing N-terminal plant-type domain-containing protein n=1 Tax=Solanum lycopersicum TaxID=4081 RepID=K4C4L9_SOLLC
MIPPGLCKLSKLISLDLSCYYIQVGRTTFTSLLHNLTNLEGYLSLEGTNMFGNISNSQIFHPPNLQVLRLGSNPLLTGTLPNFNWSFSKSILELDFSLTVFLGRCLMRLVTPISLAFGPLELPFIWFDSIIYWQPHYLSINEFRGSIPESIGNLTAITELRLPGRKKILGDHGNNISGFQELRILDLSFNCFTGAAPHWLFHLPSLFLLSVEANQLTGKLPNELKNRSSSSRHLNVYLSHNKLHGKIPDWMLSSIIMGTLDISHNFLTGFEKQVWCSTFLLSLNLENNFLQGPLHQSICDLINLHVLILAQNNFSGSIPGCLGNSSRRIFIIDLRMNNYHGEIPRFLPTG